MTTDKWWSFERRRFLGKSFDFDAKSLRFGHSIFTDGIMITQIKIPLIDGFACKREWIRFVIFSRVLIDFVQAQWLAWTIWTETKSRLTKLTFQLWIEQIEFWLWFCKFFIVSFKSCLNIRDFYKGDRMKFGSVRISSGKPNCSAGWARRKAGFRCKVWSMRRIDGYGERLMLYLEWKIIFLFKSNQTLQTFSH